MKSPAPPFLFIVLLVSILVVISSSTYGSRNMNGNSNFESSVVFHKPSCGLNAAMQRFANEPSIKNAAWGFVVVDFETGRYVVSHNKNLSIAPASTLKLLTSASAFQVLGSDFRYETILGHNGSVDTDGTLIGDLIIKGSGDPTFGSPEVKGASSLKGIFDRWLKALQGKGIKRVTGQIIADESVFDYELVPRKWIWEDIGNYYGAGSSGLTVNENMYTVYFQPGTSIGSPARVISTSPEIPDITYLNLVTTGPRNSGDQVFIYGAPYQNQRTLTGTVPLGSNNFSVRGSIPDPAMLVAQVFHQFLLDNGVEVFHKPTCQRVRDYNGIPPPKTSEVLAINASPELSEIVNRINQQSTNTLSENVLKTLGLKQKGQGSFAAGAEAIKDFWKKLGLDTDGMFLFDGSGLSPANRLTPNQLVQVIITALKHQSGQAFSEGIPVAGRTGTIANLFKGTKSEGVLRAKSGFMGNVRSYAGYTYNSNGHKLVFALMVNNFSGTSSEIREKMVNLMDAITTCEVRISRSD